MSKTGEWVLDLQERGLLPTPEYPEYDELDFVKSQLKNVEAALVRAEKRLKHMEYLESVVLSADGFTCDECGEVFGDNERDGSWYHCFCTDICIPCAQAQEKDLEPSDLLRLKEYRGD